MTATRLSHVGADFHGSRSRAGISYSACGHRRCEMEWGKTVFVSLVDVRALFEKTLRRKQSLRDPLAYHNTLLRNLQLPTMLPNEAASMCLL